MMSLLPSKYYLRHHSNQANTALLRQPELHWCPSKHCGRLLRLANQVAASGAGGVVPVICECGMFWCSECKAEAHWPATCQQAKTYRQEAKHLFSKYLGAVWCSGSCSWLVIRGSWVWIPPPPPPPPPGVYALRQGILSTNVSLDPGVVLKWVPSRIYSLQCFWAPI